jgi:hypothetical protein
MTNPFAAPDADSVIVGERCGTLFLGPKYLDVIMQLPLPGIVIFVHGVNSDGEWFSQAEAGLCQGLNDRLRRRSEQLAHPGVEGGQLHPVDYLPDLTADGYLNPDKTAKRLIASDEHFSPVIHFRWGYKASAEDLQRYGDKIYLNEQNYWGGGPFANGCTSLPDLWGEGLTDELFLWLHMQHMNPTNDRIVYACPPRAYCVLAALRLARLVQAIREKQADVPVTIVCHSQGNMVGLAAAFLGDRLAPATDRSANAGRCVADAYVLCNPPYSLVDRNFAQSWTERNLADAQGNKGRQVREARIATLRAFFDIVRAQAANGQPAATIDEAMKNEAHGFDAQADRQRHGFGPAQATLGRVTLYFNPHDQVISALTIQGIGWRGLSRQEIVDTNGAGVFCQRVFAQNFTVGKSGDYDFWKHHHGKGIAPGSKAFWSPASPPARYSISKGLDASGNWAAKIMTVASAPIMYVLAGMSATPVNALPPREWTTPLAGPDLPDPFLPEALRFGHASTAFDEGTDAPGASRDQARERIAGDPYGGEHSAGASDAARGDAASEAALRYEHHALLRMQAKREGLYKQSDQAKGRYGVADQVSEEDNLDSASDGYRDWRSRKIKEVLARTLDTHATDHSTILTNPLHAQKALAYDVAIGVCHINKEDLGILRQMADWRYLKSLEDDNSSREFFEYFLTGLFKSISISKWTKNENSPGSMPPAIIDQRRLF